MSDTSGATGKNLSDPEMFYPLSKTSIKETQTNNHQKMLKLFIIKRSPDKLTAS